MNFASQGAPSWRALKSWRSREGDGVEPGDHHLPFGHEHTLHLAKHVVRVVMAFEHVRQCDQIHTLRGEGKLQRVGGERRALLEREREPVRDAVLSQEIDFR